MNPGQRKKDRLADVVEQAHSAAYIPFSFDLLERTRHARPRHKLGLWTTPRCDPGSAAWFVAARSSGACAKKRTQDDVSPLEDKQCSDIDSSISLPVVILVVL
jgi:hypothetical protein